MHFLKAPLTIISVYIRKSDVWIGFFLFVFIFSPMSTVKATPFFQEFKGDPNTTLLFRKTVFAASEDYTVYDGKNGNPTLKLTSPIVNGIQMIKAFETVPDSYILNYSVQLINRSGEKKPLKALYFFGEQRLSDNGGGMHQVSHEGPVFFSMKACKLKVLTTSKMN